MTPSRFRSLTSFRTSESGHNATTSSFTTPSLEFTEYPTGEQTESTIASKRKNNFRHKFGTLKKSASKLLKRRARQSKSEGMPGPDSHINPLVPQRTRSSRISVMEFVARFDPVQSQGIPNASPLVMIPKPEPIPSDPLTSAPSLEEKRLPTTPPDVDHEIADTPGPNIDIVQMPSYDAEDVSCSSFLPKHRHAESDIELALKEIADFALAFPTPSSPILPWLVVYFKCLVFALAAVVMCIVAVPWACAAYMFMPAPVQVESTASTAEGGEHGEPVLKLEL